MKKKLTRAEKNELNRKNLFEAAVKVVGKFGYKDASVTDITALADVAHGTFYNHFESKQEILDHLLPELGEHLLAFLGEQVGDATFLEREERSIRAYFQFMKDKPEFYRILVEAQVYSPESFDTHAENLIRNYETALKKTKEKGYLQSYSEQEFRTIALMLLGARVYLSRQYCFRNGKAVSVPDHVVKTYMALVSGGLGGGGESRRRRARPDPAESKGAFECQEVDAGEDAYAAQYILPPDLTAAAATTWDLHVQQIVSDFIRRAAEKLMDGTARLRDTRMHISRHDPDSRLLAACKLEKLSETEVMLNVRIAGGEPADHKQVASCQAFFSYT